MVYEGLKSRHSMRSCCRRLLGVAAVALATGALGASTGRAAPGLLFGFTDNAPMTAGTKATGPALALGARGFGFLLTWQPGKGWPTPGEQTGLARAIGASGGARIVLMVRTVGATTPLTDAQRDQFCTYALNTVKEFPTINDVVIGNEANAPYFWWPQYNPDGSNASPAAYETLLAHCYDVLHAYRAGINVAAPATSPHGNDNPFAKDNIGHSPTTFIQGMAAAYKASGRTARIFDTVVHHPYGYNNAERPYEMHPGPYFIGEGDWNKLVATYQQAFAGTAQAVPGRCLPSGPCVPIWYLEAGFQTNPRPGSTIYYDSENVVTVPDVSAGEPDSPAPLATSPAPDQATQLRWALRLAYCQPYVGAVFNFLIKDDRDLMGYQSGILWADWTPKGSYGPLGSVVSQLAAGNVSCAPPSAPPGLDANVRPGPEVDLSWGGSSSQIGVSGYRIYRNGTVIGTTADRSYADTGIPAVAGYSYSVRGFDAAGQTGPASVPEPVSKSAIAAAASAATAAVGRGKGCAPLYVRAGSKASRRAFRVRILRGKVKCVMAQGVLRTFMTRHRSPKPWRCAGPHGKATWAATCSSGNRKRPRLIVRAIRVP
jgi:hypothetical protein